MNTIYKYFLLSIVFVLSGCFGTTKTEYVTKNVPVYPPSGLLVIYNVPTPPLSSEEYAEQSTNSKEESLVNYIFELLTLISKDRKDKEGLIKWSETIQQEIKDSNSKD